MAGAVVGSCFDSYESVKLFAQEYEKCKFVQLNVTNSLKLKPPKPSVIHSKMAFANVDLMYSKIVFGCVHGGEFKNKGNGQRQTK